MLEETMLDYYAARAPEYDKVYLKPERQSDLRALEEWLPVRFSGANLLEIACGTGYWTQYIAPVARHVHAIDMAAETLAIARSRVRTGRVEFAIGDAYALPPVSSKWDAAFAGFWLSHVPKQRLHAFLRGLHAALRPHAKVVFLDNRFVDGSSTPISESDADGNTYQTRTLDDGTSAHRYGATLKSTLQFGTNGFIILYFCACR